METSNDDGPDIDGTEEYRFHHVNNKQVNMLLEFLEEHPDLAQGLLRGGKATGKKKYWSVIAKKLNTVKTGAQKDAKGWSKFWCDWKYRVRRKAMELQAAGESRPSESVNLLSNVEERVLKLIGHNTTTANGLVIKKDPLSDEDDVGVNNDEDVTQKNEENTSSLGNRKSTRARKRRHSSDSDDPGSPLASLGRKPANTRNEPEPDESVEFLRIEKEKLDHTRAMREQIETIATEMTRLADAVCHIRDFLINDRNTLH